MLKQKHVGEIHTPQSSYLLQEIYNLIDEGSHLVMNNSTQLGVKNIQDISGNIHQLCWDVTPPISPLSNATPSKQLHSGTDEVTFQSKQSTCTNLRCAILCGPQHENKPVITTSVSYNYLEPLLNNEYTKTIHKTKRCKHRPPNSEAYLSRICDIEATAKPSHMRGDNGQWTRAILRDPPKGLRVPFK